MMDFDATCLYSSEMYDGNSVYPEVKSGFAFKLHTNDFYVEALNNQTFHQDDNESAI